MLIYLINCTLQSHRLSHLILYERQLYTMDNINIPQITLGIVLFWAVVNINIATHKIWHDLGSFHFSIGFVSEFFKWCILHMNSANQINYSMLFKNLIFRIDRAYKIKLKKWFIGLWSNWKGKQNTWALFPCVLFFLENTKNSIFQLADAFQSWPLQ